MSSDASNSVLTQDDIDAMVKSTPADAPPPRVTVVAGSDPPPPQVKVTAASEAPTADPDPAAAAPDPAAAAETPPAATAGGDAQMQAQIQALTQYVQALSARMDEILQQLPNTLGYGVRTTFQCNTCGTCGNVASRVVCTSCNTDTFIGWRPQ